MSLIKKAVLVVIFGCSVLSAPVHACVQENAFVFGASISAGYFNIWDVVTRYGSHKTPIEYVISNTGYDFAFNYENTIVQGGWYLDHTNSMLNDPAKVEQMKKSSALVSMDAFYWDAIDGEALFTPENTCTASIESMEAVVNFATANQVPLILANIPGEKGTPAWAYVRKISNWREPFDNCYQTFNRRLNEVCLVENNCFVVDIDNVVTRLNNETGVEWNGNTYHQEDLRSKWDGVHLTELGNEYIGFLIEEAVGMNNPGLLICN